MRPRPAVRPVLVRERFDTGERDDWNSPVFAYSDPVEWLTWGYAPGAQSEPMERNRDLSVVAWTVYGPKVGAYPRSEAAEVQIPGDDEWFPVDGRPDDWTHGPESGQRSAEPGLVVELRRADN